MLFHIKSRLGILNDRFSQIQNLKSVEQPDHVVQLINAYCTNVEIILSEIESYSHPDVDFSKLTSLARQVEERSSRIGAEHVRLACTGLIQACDQLQEDKFLMALSWMKNEFTITRDKLQAIVQMDRRIMRLDRKLQK
ncbi:histidine-containing phosphotransfer protein 1-like isoform X2 [Carica papaya]|uniref:histidine-containing phosphotransfer protein 1-like isoform X2 n=1 Tax=Carica papaya TaxID=3649 RepID=UPI000B8CF37D|nr:histidine-containing phosphotransfer protein 1-like isoform X2 [Carica papaya]